MKNNAQAQGNRADVQAEVRAARERFPRGLAQPDFFRFSLDSLLLACFARLPGGSRPLVGLDLGAGCGVVGLALLLAREGVEPGRVRMTGVELDPDMAACALGNARSLGFASQYEVERDDVSSYKHPGRVDFVLANPPYRQEGTGRLSPGQARTRARFESGLGLEGFAAAAARCLKTKAPFFLVHLAERLDLVLACLAGRGLRPKRLRMVHGQADKPARLVLVEARPGSGPGLRAEPPLVLYRAGRGTGQGRDLTPEALAFCPFLECNAGSKGAHHA